MEKMRRRKELSLVADKIRDHWRETFAAAAKRKQRKKARKNKQENNKRECTFLYHKCMKCQRKLCVNFQTKPITLRMTLSKIEGNENEKEFLVLRIPTHLIPRIHQGHHVPRVYRIRSLMIPIQPMHLIPLIHHTQEPRVIQPIQSQTHRIHVTDIDIVAADVRDHHQQHPILRTHHLPMIRVTRGQTFTCSGKRCTGNNLDPNPMRIVRSQGRENRPNHIDPRRHFRVERK